MPAPPGIATQPIGSSAGLSGKPRDGKSCRKNWSIAATMIRSPWKGFLSGSVWEFQTALS
jgi:hypothetical protein